MATKLATIHVGVYENDHGDSDKWVSINGYRVYGRNWATVLDAVRDYIRTFGVVYQRRQDGNESRFLHR